MRQTAEGTEVRRRTRSVSPIKADQSAATPLSEELYEALFRKTPEAILLARHRARFLDVNGAATLLTGYSREELLQSQTSDLFSSKDRTQLQAFWEELSANGHAAGEFTLVCRNGNELLVTLRALANVDAGVHMLTLSDISERRRSEGLLKRYAARLDMMQEVDTAILKDRPAEEIVVRSLTGLCTGLRIDRASVALLDDNREYATYLGVVGARPDLAPLGTRVKVTELLANVNDLKAGLPYVIADLRRAKQKSELVRTLMAEGMRSYVAIPMRHEDDLLGILTAWSRLPEGIADEQVDMASEVATQLAVAIRQSRLIFDLRERVKELTSARDISRLALEHGTTIGETLAKMVERLPSAWHYPEITAARITYGDAAYATDGFKETPWMLAESFESPSGKTVRIQVGYLEEPPPAWHGPFRQEEVSLLPTISDVLNSYIDRVEQVQSEAERLERAVVERTTELEERNEELQTFVSSVSHDLRGPLRMMGSFGEVVVADHRDEMTPDVLEFVERIVETATHMDLLIEDLLSYTRISRQEIQIASVDLREVVEKASRQVARSIDVKVMVTPEGPAMARCHRLLTLQVVTNLLTNAVKFVPSTRQPRVKIAIVRRRGSLRVSVSDNGIGIAKRHRARIFRPFERLESSGATEGTGIGLAIVKRAMTRMGGRFGLTSRVGRGTTFWFELPASDDA